MCDSDGNSDSLYDGPVIDAHHHFWDPATNYHPWLRDEPMIAFRYGDYAPLKQPFLPADYRRVADRHNVVANVTMEGEWDPRDPLGESRWMQQLAASSGSPQAHVAQIWLDADDAAEVLAAQAAFAIVKSVRHKPRAAASPEYVERGAPGSLSCPRWRAGYAELAQFGLRFDLQVPWWHLYEAAELAGDYPATPLILNHTGLPSERSPAALAGWREALRALADAPHAWLKISGLGLPGQPWRLDDNRKLIRDAIDIFGVHRCMFASNFPVDGLCGSFDVIYNGFKQAVADLPPAQQRRLFHDNAAACYDL